MHMNYPIIPRPMPYPNINYEEEIYNLKQEILKLDIFQSKNWILLI